MANILNDFGEVSERDTVDGDEESDQRWWSVNNGGRSMMGAQ